MTKQPDETKSFVSNHESVSSTPMEESEYHVEISVKETQLSDMLTGEGIKFVELGTFPALQFLISALDLKAEFVSA